MGETHAHSGGQTLGGENPLGGGQALGGGQVLSGGEIPVGRPQQMALMFEMIKGMQQNQVELAKSLKQLREANGNKEDHQNKNDNRNHEERESHNKNDTSFVTMSDVADLLKQERERPPKEPRHFVRRPPYPIELLKDHTRRNMTHPFLRCLTEEKGAPWNISVSFWIPWDPLLHMVISVCRSSQNLWWIKHTLGTRYCLLGSSELGRTW